jgi:hypothetical protein
MNVTRLLVAGLFAAGLLTSAQVEARSRRYCQRHPYAQACQGYGGGQLNGCCAPPPNWNCCGPTHNMCVNPCNPCAQPLMAPAMQPMYQTQLRPVYQTTLQPQQFVTYQQVPQVQYQRQAYVEQVPVTVYQPQVRYRDVAVQVNQVVAQMQTQYVPRQTVQYIPETRMVGMQPTGMQFTGWQYGGATMYGAYPTVPMTAGLPMFSLPGEPIPYPQQAAELPTPDPHHLTTPGGDASGASWSTIRQRGAGSTDGQTSYLPVFPSSIVPTAAVVWQSRLDSPGIVR